MPLDPRPVVNVEKLLDRVEPPDGLKVELERLLNEHSAESGSNTPDYLLARFLIDCLRAYNTAIVHRATWYRRWDEPGRGSVDINADLF
jgi:hypothetical protein